ncbi:MAG TPA: DNA alkylation repair protein [Cyclobacteriaceae bacterium]|nr:DNA alkylation repair protein [Cyclobacteriaceae bacterium]
MHVKEALSALKSLTNETMVARNLKNGAGKNQFGVMLGDIRTLANKIKTDHALALQLWKTENIDARLLATLIIQPKKLSAKELDELVKSIAFVQEADWLNSYVVKDHPQRETLREKWMSSKNRWAARAGWSLTSGRVSREPEGLDLAKLLDRIESEMPSAPSEVQWTMNTTLAQIGINFPAHRKRAISIGEALGVYRDFPVSKGCTSPFAPIWINEMVKRKS